jgi:hypothetical protein
MKLWAVHLFAFALLLSMCEYYPRLWINRKIPMKQASRINLRGFLLIIIIIAIISVFYLMLNSAITFIHFHS